MKRLTQYLVSVISFLMIISSVMKAQVTIWSENFSGYSNGTTTGANNNTPPATNDWTTSCATCNLANEFSVQGNAFNISNTDELATWTSETIDISGYSNVTITIDVDMDDNQLDATDCVTFYYNVGGGNVQMSINGSLCDDGLDPTLVGESGLSGSTLVISFQGITTETNEDIFIDNILVVGTLALGHTGPGGVGLSDGTDALELWLRADAEAYSDAGTTLATHGVGVRQWNDQSGNGRDATQATSGNRPLYHLNAANGYPGLRFTGNLFIDGPALGIGSTSSYTYLMALRDTTTSLGGINDGSGHFILDRTTATNNLVSLKPITGSVYAFQKRNDAGGGLGGPSTTTNINTNSKVIEMRRNYNTNYQIYYNNSLQGTLAESDGATTPPNPRIGRHATTANGGIRGYIYEFIIYSEAINAAQTIIVNNYLAAKYGFALTANDLYDEDASGYDHEVAGIGQASDGTNHTDAQGTGAVRINTPNGLGNSEFLIWGHDNGAMSSYGVTDLPAGIQARLARDWAASETGEVGTVTISFDLSSVFGSITTSDLRLLIDDDGVYASGATATAGATSLGGGVYQWTGIDIDNNQHFTVGSINSTQTPLPVELISFSAIVSDSNAVDLTWTTASEVNNDYFTIERSFDEETWVAIERVPASGNSRTYIEYETVDRNPVIGLSFYRLKQTDLDGKFSYSEIRKVLMYEQTINDGSLAIIPNPTAGYVTILSNNEELFNFQVLALSGVDVSDQVNVIERSISQMRLDLSALPHGLYVIKTLRSAELISKQ
ncbi:MAG: hypothetical protein R2813_11800 [Flavobacteriales bacterium]